MMGLGTGVVLEMAAKLSYVCIQPSVFTEENRRRFRRDGYIYLEGALDPEMPDRLLGDLSHKTYLKVESPAGRLGVTTFYSKNGARLMAASPLVAPLESELIGLTNWLSGIEYLPLDNRAIGASANVTPAGGGFATHFDRQEISAIAYLNRVEGGELHLWPGLRKWEPQWLGRHAARVTMFLTTVLRPVGIAPTKGSVLLFNKFTPHRVAQVHSTYPRVSIIFGLDRPGVSFLNGAAYYGDAEESVTIGDLKSG